MGDLEIIEMLLHHPHLKDQVMVRDNEISDQFKAAFRTKNPEGMQNMYNEIKDAMPGRRTARVFDEIFIERVLETETANR